MRPALICLSLLTAIGLRALVSIVDKSLSDGWVAISSLSEGTGVHTSLD